MKWLCDEVERLRKELMFHSRNEMNDTVTKLMALADEYMIQERDGTNGFEARQALQDEMVKLFTPLTREQVKGILSDSGYEDAETDALCDFINGIRYGEICHGITGESNET